MGEDAKGKSETAEVLSAGGGLRGFRSEAGVATGHYGAGRPGAGGVPAADAATPDATGETVRPSQTDGLACAGRAGGGSGLSATYATSQIRLNRLVVRTEVFACGEGNGRSSAAPLCWRGAWASVLAAARTDG